MARVEGNRPTASVSRNVAVVAEWEQWRSLCDQLAALGICINDQDALARAITEWGNARVALRLT